MLTSAALSALGRKRAAANGDVVVVIDAGTGGGRAVAVDAGGVTRARSHRIWSFFEPPGLELYGREFEPAKLLATLAECCREVVETVQIVNDPPLAFPAIIPGPSELPLLYDNQTAVASRGTVGVRPGDRVYLRGWGVDQNLNAPEQFNPDAPMFDIYGSKNGDWGQSAFAFSRAKFFWAAYPGQGLWKTRSVCALATSTLRSVLMESTTTMS